MGLGSPITANAEALPEETVGAFETTLLAASGSRIGSSAPWLQRYFRSVTLTSLFCRLTLRVRGNHQAEDRRKAVLQLFFERLNAWTSVPDTFASLFANSENVFWLDREHHQTERYSVIGASSRAIELGQSGFEQLREAMDFFATVSLPENHLELPFSFRPGLVGTLSYEFKLATGASARHWQGEPLGHQLLVDRAMVFDHDSKHLYFLGIFPERAEFDAWYHAALLRLALVGGEAGNLMLRAGAGAPIEPLGATPETPGAEGDESGYDEHGPLLWRDSETRYLEMIEAAKHHIAEGDCYQLCLTTSASAVGDWHPLAIFLKLRKQNPAPYAGFFKVGDFHLISSSPEQFLRVAPDGSLSSKPIKGTRARGVDAESDLALERELRDNVKERAENLMIVDLVRNDLGRVAEPESVVVSKLFQVESYATVHQLVSTVEAKLSPGKDAVDALAAMFPAGSMTGAPKLRAMELIDDLEGVARGCYSGVFGFLGCNGAAEWGMVIRSIVIEGKILSLGVGGGITSDSIPSQEFAETRIKARALLRAIGIDILR